MKEGRPDKHNEFSVDGDLPWYKVKNQAFRVCLFTEAFFCQIGWGVKEIPRVWEWMKHNNP